MSSTRGRGLVIRRRVQGLAFLVVLALLLGLSVALYNKAFTDVAMVTLETDTAGSQLQEASDVKVRGVIVGEVREIEADVEGATIRWRSTPSTWTRSRPTSPRGCCPRRCSASGSSPWRSRRRRPRSASATAT